MGNFCDPDLHNENGGHLFFEAQRRFPQCYFTVLLSFVLS